MTVDEINKISQYDRVEVSILFLILIEVIGIISFFIFVFLFFLWFLTGLFFIGNGCLN